MPSTKSPSSSELMTEIERIAARTSADHGPKPSAPAAGRTSAAKPPSITEKMADRARRDGHRPLDLDGKSKVSIAERVRSAQRHAGEPVKGGRK